MQELKKRVSELFAEYQKHWINEFNNAKKEGHKFNLSNVMTNSIDVHLNIDKAFIEAQDRIRKVGKKGWF